MAQVVHLRANKFCSKTPKEDVMLVKCFIINSHVLPVPDFLFHSVTSSSFQLQHRELKAPSWRCCSHWHSVFWLYCTNEGTLTLGCVCVPPQHWSLMHLKSNPGTKSLLLVDLLKVMYVNIKQLLSESKNNCTIM